MLTGQTAGKPKKDKSLGLFHAEAAASSVENAGIGYQSATLIDAGAAAQGVATLSTLTHLIYALLLVKVPSLLQKYGSLRKLVLILSIVSSIAWLPLVFTILFLGKVSPGWLIVLWLFNLVPGLLASPLRDNWLAELAPSNKLGRYLSVRSAITAGAYIVTLFAMGYTLDASKNQIFTGYSMVLTVAFFASLTACLMLILVRSPGSDNKADKQDSDFGFFNFLGEARRDRLGTFILYVALMLFSVHLCSTLFAVYMLRDLHLNYLTFTMIIASEHLARIISLTFFWGTKVDKAGTIRVLTVVSRLIPLVPVLWIFSSNVIYLILIQLFSGVLWAAFDLCNQTFVYKASPKPQRLRYIVYHKSMSTLAAAAGALAGAFLLSFVLPVFGNRILGLFLVSGIFRFLVVAYISPKLRDISQPFSPPAGSSINIGTALRKAADRKGLYYHPEYWAAFYSPLENKALKPVPAGRGVFYHPELWNHFTGSYKGKSKAVAPLFHPKIIPACEKETARYSVNTAIAVAPRMHKLDYSRGLEQLGTRLTGKTRPNLIKHHKLVTSLN